MKKLTRSSIKLKGMERIYFHHSNHPLLKCKSLFRISIDCADEGSVSFLSKSARVSKRGVLYVNGLPCSVDFGRFEFIERISGWELLYAKHRAGVLQMECASVA